MTTCVAKPKAVCVLIFADLRAERGGVVDDDVAGVDAADQLGERRARRRGRPCSFSRGARAPRAREQRRARAGGLAAAEREGRVDLRPEDRRPAGRSPRPRTASARSAAPDPSRCSRCRARPCRRLSTTRRRLPHSSTPLPMPEFLMPQAMPTARPSRARRRSAAFTASSVLRMPTDFSSTWPVENMSPTPTRCASGSPSRRARLLRQQVHAALHGEVRLVGAEAAHRAAGRVVRVRGHAPRRRRSARGTAPHAWPAARSSTLPPTEA